MLTRSRVETSGTTTTIVVPSSLRSDPKGSAYTSGAQQVAHRNVAPLSGVVGLSPLQFVAAGAAGAVPGSGRSRGRRRRRRRGRVPLLLPLVPLLLLLGTADG